MTSGGSVSTTTPGMQQAAGHMQGTKATADSGVSSVAGALAALKATWKGEASGAFDGSMNAWLSDCRYISTKLNEMIEVMHRNRQVITSGEAYNTQAAAAIPVGHGMKL